MLAREGQMSTALGEGIAVPHARLPGLVRSVLVMARHPIGVDWNAQDDKPVRTVFLILTNEEDASTQLRFLRGISGMMGEAAIRDDLLTAPSASDILARMRQYTNTAAQTA